MLITRHVRFLAVIVAAFSLTLLFASGTARAALFQEGACSFDVPANAGEVFCGTVSVAADRSGLEGEQVSISLVVLKARNASTLPGEKGPVVFLHGGPGASALRGIERWIDSDLREHRDLIVLDQRGSEKSGVFCKELGAAVYEIFEADVSLSQQSQAIAEKVLACRAAVAADGIDFENYKTSIIARDMDDVRQALGYDKWVPFGVSYGTAVALAMIEMFPDTLEAVVLDSVSPNDRTWRQQTGDNYDLAVDRLFEECRKQPDCEARFPDLKGQYEETLEALNANPLTVQTMDKRQLTYNVQDFVLTLHQWLYHPSLIRYVPLFIESVRQRNAAIVGNLAVYMRPRAENMAFGVHYAVDCQGRGLLPERIAEILHGQESDVAEPDLSLFPLSHQYAAVCETLGLENADPDAVLENSATMPVLVLMGELDPITPPETLGHVEQYLANMEAFKFSGHGHAVFFSSPCARSVLQAFIDNPTSNLREDPRTACANEEERVAFRTDRPSQPGAFALVTGLGITPSMGTITLTLLLLGTAALGLFVAARPSIWRKEGESQGHDNLLRWSLGGNALALWALIIALAWWLGVEVLQEKPLALFGMPEWLAIGRITVFVSSAFAALALYRALSAAGEASLRFRVRAVLMSMLMTGTLIIFIWCFGLW